MSSAYMSMIDINETFLLALISCLRPGAERRCTGFLQIAVGPLGGTRGALFFHRLSVHSDSFDKYVKTSLPAA